MTLKKASCNIQLHKKIKVVENEVVILSTSTIYVLPRKLKNKR